MMKGQNNHSKDTIARMPKGQYGLEIGVWKGESTVKFAAHSAHVDAVDPWSVEVYEEGSEYDYDEYLDKYEHIVGSRDPEDFQRFYDYVHETVCRKANKAGNITVIRMSSKQFFEQNTKVYDWVYVDGDHSYEGCYYDLVEAWKIIRPGGILFGDDYTNKPEVKKAVDQFLDEVGYKAMFYHNQFKLVKPE